ncbi:response regulator [Mesorhizobium sp. BR1-1-14]|uniref:response regulator n=1 Tax=Mesorhizobium sp. BR1-1-14 TaxID=2876655 RepID=UPI0021E32C1D|nr:response regulator [Mesorhizobium sp. BR1-1-14]
MADALTRRLANKASLSITPCCLAMLSNCRASTSMRAILLDRTLPDGEGLSFIPRLRAAGVDAPVIVLTARNEPKERIEGLDAGTDDYLGKPFLIDELMARLRAVLRRSRGLPLAWSPSTR